MIDKPPSAPVPVLGTAHLYSLVPADRCEQLLRAAFEYGYARVDTAPAYGFGRSEPAVGRVLAELGLAGRVHVTTKVGLAADAEPGTVKRIAKAAARRLPATVRDRLRGAPSAPHGRFVVPDVGTSVERSLRVLPRIDRLLMHEVRASDLTDELLVRLDRFRRDGDVGAVGVASTAGDTAACVARAPDLLTTVNVAIDTRERLPAVDVVGHGVFGPAGAELGALTERLRGDPVAAAGWQVCSPGTPWAGNDGFARLVATARVSRAPVSAVIVASASAERLRSMYDVLSEPTAVPDWARQILDRISGEPEAAPHEGFTRW